MSRLAGVLADALHSINERCEGDGPAGHGCGALASDVVAAIPEPVREAIEAALDVCAVCGMWSGWGDHDDNPGFRMAVGGSYHPYQPLVAP